MNTIEQMLRHLARTEVTELALASDRLPCVKINGKFEPVDTAAPPSAALLQMLAAAGGGEHIDALNPKPTPWTVVVPGVGTVTAAAVQRDGKILARFVVSQRQAPPAPAPPKPTKPAQPTQTAPSAAPLSPEPPPRAVPPVMPVPAPPAPTAISTPTFSFSLEPTTPAPAKVTSAPAAPAAPAPEAKPTPEAKPPAAPAVDVKPPPPPPRPLPSVPASPTRLELVLAAARDASASDIHIVADRPLLFRIGGELIPLGDPLDPARVEKLVIPHIPERCRGPLNKDGSCDFALDALGQGRFRVNVTRQRTGLKACLRVIPREIPTLASLGLPEEITKATHHHQGLIVVTGPTGHGKTSTLAAIIDVINRETSHHVITVEDPIEYVHPQKQAVISQREVGTHTLSFQNALKASLREDPDVIVVGELRDTETVRMALAASETGHLVLGTMNTPSAAKTIDRLIDLFPPGDQQQVRMTLAGGLRLIVSQRLLPTPDGSSMAAAAELLPGSIALWSLIRDNKTFQIPSLQQRGKGFGIIRLDDSLADLVRQGRSTREAALAVAEAPDELAATLDRQAGGAEKKGAAEGKDVKDTKAAGGGFLQRAGSLLSGKKG